MAVELGSAWTVQCQRVQGAGVGGAGANDTGEYATASISSVARDNTWVWGTGFTDDNGIGDSAEAVLVTLGDGVNQNVNETLLAAGLENADDIDFQVCAMTHPNLAVDYRFKVDGNTADLTFDQTVDSASAGARMALVTNGSAGTGTAFPRPLFSARYLNNTTVRLERRRFNQPFPAWVQGINFSNFLVRASTTLDNDPVSSDPALANGTPVDLVEGFDGFELEPGETLNIEFQVTVDSPIPAGVTGYVCPTTVDSAEGDPDSDSAFNPVGQPGIIGDFVWFDLDGDGNQDAAEPGIPNAQVNLHAGTSCDGPVLESAVTDADGLYLFDDLPAGDYCVEVYEATLPPLYTSTTSNNPTTLTLAAGATDDTVDFGYGADGCLPEVGFERDALGNALLAGQTIDNEFAPWGLTISAVAGGGGVDEVMVFNTGSPTGGDTDLGTPNETFGGPGIGGGGEAGQPNENRTFRGNVGIISANGDETNPNDNAGGGVITYAFDRDVDFDRVTFVDSGDTAGVAAGEIRLFDSGGTQIGAGISIIGSGDNGVNEVSGIGATGVRTAEIEFFGSASIDALFTCSLPERDARLGDRVWLDVDADGIQDVGEPGLANVQVTLYDAGANGAVGGGDDVAVATLLTDTNGFYLFTDLPPGTFYVDVTDATVPAGLTITAGSTDPGALVTLAAGGVDLNSDFGYFNANAGTAVVGDTVWIDSDADGLLEPGEQGVEGVTVALLSPGPDGVLGTGDDVTEATTSTNADGRYLFTGVAPGDYIVDVTDTGGVLTGYTLTTGPQSVSDPSGPFNVQGGDVYLLADFGYDRAGLFSVDDVVWFDADGDGTLDAGENGLAGVTVDLLDSDGEVIASTVTDANGAFSFDGLENGNYTLKITDTDAVLLEFTSTTLAAAAGELDFTIAGADVSGVNFGYNRPGVLGDFVWSDADSDGVQDPAEPGIPGVTVELYFDLNGNGVLDIGTDTLAATTTTDAFGRYLFEDLFTGTYFASVDETQGALTGFSGTTADDEGAAGDQVQGQVTASTAFLDADFGYVNTALPDISGNVFEDFDRDGLDDGVGDPGIGGVTVALLDASGNVIATTTTDAAGDYSFQDLPAGDYTVTVTDDAAVLEDFELTSSLDAIDVTVVASDITGLDFGYARDASTAALGDFVWLDANGDGQQGGAENGIGGVTVRLFDPGADNTIGGGDDVLLQTTVTDANGLYLFDGLAAGNYYASVDTSTLPAAGASLVATTANPSVIFAIAEGEVELDADFGFGSAGGVGAIGDFVWFDADADGNQDPGETGIGGVEIELTGPGCSPCTVLTDADGSYLFTGLAPGTYQVNFDAATLPGIYDPNPTNTAVGWQVVIAGGEVETVADFGFPASGLVGSIGDFVWFDADGDGVQDAGEAGIPGVTVDLLDATGTTVLASTVTDSSGGYDFLGLAAGTYQVTVTDTAAVLTSLNLTGGSDPTGAIVLSAGQDFNDADFGYAPSGGSGIIGSHVWRDLNDNGVREAGEPGFERVSVELWVDENNNGVIEPGIDNLVRTELTDTEGAYEFRGLPAGDYLVRPTDVNGVLTGFTKTNGTAGVDENSQVIPYDITLTVGAPNNLTADFGYSAAADLTIAGTAFFDLDGDGSLEPEDPGVEVVTVLLFRDLDGDGVLDGDDALIDAQISDVNGDYLFTDLPPGDYIVAVDATGTFVDGGVQTTQLLTASVEPVTLVAVNSVDNDFGFTRAATLALVAELEADLTAEGLVVRWSTSSESGTAGFRLERWTESSFAPVHILAAPFGAPQGSAYRVLDPAGAAPGDRVRYRLVEIQRAGIDLIHGPYSVEVGERPLRKALSADGADAAPRAARGDWLERAAGFAAENRRSRAEKMQTGADAVKLLVRNTGVQRIAIADLASAFDRDVAQVSAALANGLLQLRRGETVVAHRVVGGELEFFGEALDSLYALDQVYWLETGSGVLMAQLPGSGGSPDPGGAFNESLHFEEDVFAGTFVARDAELDYWHWRGLIANNPNFGSTAFDVNLPNLDPAAPVKLRAFLRGASDGPVPNEHHAVFSVGGQVIGDTFFSDLADHTVELDVSAGIFAAGMNTLTVEALLDTGAVTSFFYIDGFDVDYRRGLVAAGDELAGGFEGRATVTVEGFGGPAVEVYDITEPDAPILITDALAEDVGGSWRVTFGRPVGAERFLATAVAQTPVLVADVASDLRNEANEGEYLVLTVDALRAAAERLAALRSDRLATKVVLLEDVMDEWNAGVYDPRALRDFLSWAASNWAVPPRYVVLVGAGHFDYRDIQGLGGNPMPPLMVATPFGLYASDLALTDFDGDRVPDLRVGRIPVLGSGELDAYVNKLATYEASVGPWADEVLLVADDDDLGGTFEANNDRVEAALPSVVRAQRIDLGSTDVPTARQQLFDALDQGAGLLHWIGHGGVDRLADEGLLVTADVPGLGDVQSLPVVAALSCNIARFELPGFDALAEDLVLEVTGGAVAAWAPSGQAFDFESHKADLILAEEAFSPANETIGDIFYATTRRFAGEALLPWSVEIYNLIGDPALIPALPVAASDAVVDLALRKTVTPLTAEPGDTVTYRLEVSNAGAAEAIDADVFDAVPDALEQCSWECIAQRGSGCVMPQAFGSLRAIIDLPSQEELVFVGTCRIADDAVGTIRNVASVVAPLDADDSNLANNEDEAIVTIGDGSLIFQDGFELGNVSAWSGFVNN
ncbi:MAG: SdrD B-like domain-containing protein [Acidobacteriota bacterium]